MKPFPNTYNTSESTLKKNGLYVGSYAGCFDCSLIPPFHIDNFTVVKRCQLGAFSGINSFSWMVDTQVGRYVSIGSRCSIGAVNHPIDWLSTSCFQYKSQIWADDPTLGAPPSLKFVSSTRPTSIGHDVWIGDNVFVRSGVNIGIGAIIAAGSVVVKNVAPYSVVGGSPSKEIKYRHPPEIIERLLKSAWWEFDQKELANCPFNDVNIALDFIDQLRRKFH